MELHDNIGYGENIDNENHNKPNGNENIARFRWDPKMILKEENAEIRMFMIKGTGIVQVIQALGAEVIDNSLENYELLSFDKINGRYRPYLKMLNPSTETWHIEGVHPNCKTIREAIEWRNGSTEKPTILT